MLDKTYAPHKFEEKFYKKEEPFFETKRTGGKTYCIMMPPPNVTGSLHLGHALTYTLQDILIRFKRAQGYDVLWQAGTDHAGIATQMVVERMLAAENKSRKNLGRKAFLEHVWDWKEKSGSTIVNQQRSLCISADWSRARFTMDEGLSKSVIKVFVDLYQQGLIYRDKRLSNWDIQFQTAISDLEVINKEEKGHFWYIAYPLVDERNEHIIVATTRPETLFGDQAIAVHPDDERYQHLIGKFVTIPLTNRQIPIIADTYCDMEKGSGAVKITPSHDFNDFEVGKRHHLPHLSIMDEKGYLSNNVPGVYQGVFYLDARQKVIQDLNSLDLIKQTTEIVHTVPYGERSNKEVQPLLTDQWFIDAKKMVQPAIDAVKRGETGFIPKQWENTYFEWLENIQPWCISRQLWWGHQIPAWFGEDGHIFVAENADQAYAQARGHYGKDDVHLYQDEDVLDTWFSSALWPFSTLGWPDQEAEIEAYYPTSVLVTGFDIIFFWVARMMMMGLHFIKQVPFKDVYIHALVRDEHGQKMSKSKGNVIDPMVMIEQYGVDAVRYTLCALSTPGRDIKMSPARVEINRNFMTKLWNSARFLQMNHCQYQDDFEPSTVVHPLNRWLIQSLSLVAKEATENLETYRFDLYASHIYQWFWNTYCGMYLEAMKPIINGEDANKQDVYECQGTAVYGFLTMLRLLHPAAPMITEYLWHTFVSDDSLIMNQSWPVSDLCFQNDYDQMEHVFKFAGEVRSLKGLLGVQPGVKIDVQMKENLHAHNILMHRNLVCHLARLQQLSIVSVHNQGVPFVEGVIEATAILGQDINLMDLKKILDTKIQKLSLDIERLDKKIQNEAYKNAKPDDWAEARDLFVEKRTERDKIVSIKASM